MSYKATRSEAFAAINSEREYQHQLRRDGVETNLAKGVDRHWAMDLVTIQKICRDIEEAAYHHAGPPPMDFFRKIAAVAVHTMETYGAPKREMPDPWADYRQPEDPA